MPDFKLPLSGDVIQAINPWNWVFQPQGSQFGLVNINLGKSGDPAMEQRILDEVGSYGRQLGRIGDALGVLVDNIKLEKLDAGERKALEDFRFQLEQVKRVKDQG